MRGFVATILFAIALNAHAEDWANVSLYSYHLEGAASLSQPCGKNQDVTNCTPGVGLEHDFARDLRGIAHTYSNSHGNASFDLALGYAPLRFLEHYRAGILFGGVTGYKDNPLSPTWLGAFTLSYENRGAGWNVIVVPVSGWVFHLQRKVQVHFLE